jgi:hypothetical protein
MLRHEAYCSALNGVAAICTCGALGRATKLQLSRAHARERAQRSSVAWSSGWFVGAEDAEAPPGLDELVPAEL